MGFPATSGVFLEAIDAATLLGVNVEAKREGVLGFDPCSYWDFNELSGSYSEDKGTERADAIVRYSDTPPVAYWKFNTGSGVVLSDTALTTPAADGTITGAPPWEASGGPTGTAGDYSIKFEGSPDQVEITGNPSKLQITGDLTISMWIKPSNIAASRQQPFNKAYSGEGTITQETNGTLNFYHGHGGGDGPPGSYQGSNSVSAVTQGAWNHIVVTRDSDSVKWYINGDLKSITANTFASSVSSQNVIIGNGYANNYLGSIDEVAIFNSALAPGQISSIYNSGSPGDLTDGTFASTAPGGSWGPHYMNFDGNNQRAETTSNSGLGASSFAIAAWARIPGDTGGAIVKVGNSLTGVGVGVGSSGGAGNFDSDGKQLIILYEAIRWIPTGVSLTQDIWNHIVLSVNSSGHPTVFLNGSQIYTDTGSGPIAPSMETGIGAYFQRGRALAVDVDEAALFCDELSSGDVQILYQLGPSSAVSFADGVSLSESVSTNLALASTAYSRSPADGLSLSESVTLTLTTSIIQGISDGVILSEDQIETIDSKMTPDGTSVSEIVSFSKAKERTDGLNIGENFSLSVSFSRYGQDSIKLSDAPTTIGGFVRSPLDTAKLSELFDKDTLGIANYETLKLKETFTTNIVNKKDTVVYTGTIEDLIELRGTII